jgi:hypothetical protein
LIEETLVEYLKGKMSLEPTVDSNKYKVKYTITKLLDDDIMEKIFDFLPLQ